MIGTWSVNPARRAPEGAAESANAHSAGPGFCICRFVGLLVCLLWGCDEIRREKHGVSFVVSSFVVRQLLPTPDKHGTKIDHKWDQFGPGGGKGQPKINKKNKYIKNANVKNQNKKKRCFWNVGRFSQKTEGSTAGRLPYFSTNIINIAYKT